MLTHPQMLTKKLWKTDIRETERKIKVKQEDTGDEPVLRSSGDSKIQPNPSHCDLSRSQSHTHMLQAARVPARGRERLSRQDTDKENGITS